MPNIVNINIKEIQKYLDFFYDEINVDFESGTTSRGFDLLQFKDDYGVVCDIQESSHIEPHIWLGTHEAKAQILASKVMEGGTGWVDYPLPEDVNITHRMHLTKNQCVSLGLVLLKYGLFEEL